MVYNIDFEELAERLKSLIAKDNYSLELQVELNFILVEDNKADLEE